MFSFAGNDIRKVNSTSLDGEDDGGQEEKFNMTPESGLHLGTRLAAGPLLSYMSVRAASESLRSAAPVRRSQLLRWGGALTVGLVAISSIRCRSSGCALTHAPSLIWARDLPRFWGSVSRPFSLFTTTTTTANMSHLSPPQPAPQWNHTAQDILQLTKEALDGDRAVQDKVATLKPEDCNFKSVRNI